jgi:hypothetical protein
MVGDRPISRCLAEIQRIFNDGQTGKYRAYELHLGLTDWLDEIDYLTGVQRMANITITIAGGRKSGKSRMAQVLQDTLIDLGANVTIKDDPGTPVFLDESAFRFDGVDVAITTETR